MRSMLFRPTEHSSRHCSMFVTLLAIGMSAPAAAQEPQAEAAPKTVVENFADTFRGSWNVVLGPGSQGALDTLHGTANVGNDGVSLTLVHPDRQVRYQSDEIVLDAIEHVGPAGLQTTEVEIKSATITFGRSAGAAEHVARSAAVPIALPRSVRQISFRQAAEQDDSGAELLLPVDLSQRGPDRLKIVLEPTSDTSRAEGTWNEVGEGRATAVGDAVWSRNAPAIDRAFIVTNQAREAYPFKHDGTEAETAGSKTRKLIVHGTNLQYLAAAGAQLGSSSDAIAYAFDPQGIAAGDAELLRIRTEHDIALARAMAQNPPDPQVIAALARRTEALADRENLTYVDATLRPGVTPGSHRIVLDDSGAHWQLQFMDQLADLQFSRYDDQIRADSNPVFYPGDVGAVDIVLQTDMPIDSIGVLLMRRPAEGTQDEYAERDRIGHGMSATRVDDFLAQGKAIYRSEPIHFVSEAFPEISPLKDENAFVMHVNDGDRIGARLIDTTQTSVLPEVVMADIVGVTDDLGDLWTSALRRAAACYGETYTGSPRYAFEESTVFSELIVGELVKYVSPAAFIAAELSGDDSPLDFDPSIAPDGSIQGVERTVGAMKGDHAAAILIRDELVKLMSHQDTVAPIAALADNANGEIQALRQRALENGVASEPLIAHGSAIWKRKPFWKQPTIGKAFNALFGTGGAASAVDDGALTQLTLAETLDIHRLAERFDVPYEEAEEWAIEATQNAAKLQLTNLERAIGRADNAGDCNVEELLIVAGQESKAAVDRINPRLVRKITYPGPPPHSFFRADQVARGFVERLHLTGSAVRALEEYGALDDAYKAMAVAAATAGAAAGASALGFSGTAAGMLIAGDAADAAYFGAKGLERAIASQEFLDYAHGASLVIGDQVLIDAQEQLLSVETSLLGLIAPGASGMLGVRNLRHFRNIAKGKALAKRLGSGGLDDLDSLTAAQKTELRAYYADLMEKTGRSGFKEVDEDDLRAMAAFAEFEANNAARLPQVPGSIADDASIPVLRDLDETLPPPAATAQLDETVTQPPPRRFDWPDQESVTPEQMRAMRAREAAVAQRLESLGVTPENARINAEIQVNKEWTDNEALIIAARDTRVPADRLMREANLSREEIADALTAYGKSRGSSDEVIDDMVRRYLDEPFDDTRIEAPLLNPQLDETVTDAGVAAERSWNDGDTVTIHPRGSGADAEATFGNQADLFDDTTTDAGVAVERGWNDGDTVTVHPQGPGADATFANQADLFESTAGNVAGPVSRTDPTEIIPSGRTTVAPPGSLTGSNADGTFANQADLFESTAGNVAGPVSRTDPTEIIPPGNTTMMPPGSETRATIGGEDLIDTRAWNPDDTIPPRYPSAGIGDTMPPQSGVVPSRTPIEEAVSRQRRQAELEFASNPEQARARLGSLDVVQNNLDQQTPGQRQVANRLHAALSQLGIRESNALTFSSLHSVQGRWGATQQMTEARIVAHGIWMHGTRPVTAREIAELTGVTPLAARVAMEEVVGDFGRGTGMLHY